MNKLEHDLYTRNLQLIQEIDTLKDKLLAKNRKIEKLRSLLAMTKDKRDLYKANCKYWFGVAKSQQKEAQKLLKSVWGQ